jgi:hypothetical protein
MEHCLFRSKSFTLSFILLRVLYGVLLICYTQFHFVVVVILRGIMLIVVILNVVNLSAMVLSIILMSVFILSVVDLSAVKLSVNMLVLLY